MTIYAIGEKLYIEPDTDEEIKQLAELQQEMIGEEINFRPYMDGEGNLSFSFETE